MTFSVRPATRRDSDAIIALSSITLAEHRARFPDHFKGEDAAAKFLNDYFAGRSRGEVLVAEDGGAILGWTGYARFEIPASDKTHDVLGLVIDLTVAEDARGQGVASSLLAKLVEEAEANGITYVHADVWQGAPSAGVLTRAGIVPVKTVHELRIDKPRKGRPKAERLKRLADNLLPILTIILAAILFFELFRR